MHIKCHRDDHVTAVELLKSQGVMTPPTSRRMVMTARSLQLIAAIVPGNPMPMIYIRCSSRRE